MPSDFIHPVLGPLSYDEGLNWYSAEVGSLGVPKLYLSLDDCPDEVAFLQHTPGRVERLPADIALAMKAASSLLELANGEWRPESAPALNVRDFLARLTVDSLTLFPDQSAEILFRADDLFAGHGVLVTIDADGRTSDPVICG